jgi:hypothetical protein
MAEAKTERMSGRPCNEANAILTTMNDDMLLLYQILAQLTLELQLIID